MPKQPWADVILASARQHFHQGRIPTELQKFANLDRASTQVSYVHRFSESVCNSEVQFESADPPKNINECAQTLL